MNLNYSFIHILNIFILYIFISLFYSLGVHFFFLHIEIFLLILGLNGVIFTFSLLGEKYLKSFLTFLFNSKIAHYVYLGSVTVILTIILFRVSWQSNFNMSFILIFLCAILVYTFGVERFMISAFFHSKRGRSIFILSLYFIVSYFIFHSMTQNIFRSDYWLIASLFNTQSISSFTGLKKIIFFEMFGDIRFQPLGHLVMYLRHLIFGNSIVLYNILNIALHSITAFLIFLIIFEITGITLLSSLLGVIYIVLPSQFDSVVWTYHLYIILSTICVLLSIYMVLKYILTNHKYYFFFALILNFLAVLLYEPTLFSPVFLFLLMIGMAATVNKKLTNKKFILIGSSIILFYAFYFIVASVSLIFLKLNESERMSLTDLFKWENLLQCTFGILMNLWKTNFITNIGIPPQIKIEDIVYIHSSKEIFKSISQILLLFCGIFFLSCFRIFKKNIWIVFSLFGIAISYIFIISLGRVLTNDFEYIISQPRYQYFANAVLFIGTGVLLVRKYEKREIRVVLKYFLATIFFLNSLNVMQGIKEVSAAMKPMNGHYYTLKEFFKNNDKTKMFLDFVPDTEKKLFLGTDIALDILFKEKITKSLKEATHVYDGREIYKNSLREANRKNFLNDFTIQWLYKHWPNQKPTKNINIIGGGNYYPKVSLSPNGYISIIMKNEDSGLYEEIKIKHSYEKNVGNWSSMVIEKNGNEIFLIIDKELKNKIPLKGCYGTWESDGYKLMGDFYRGAGDAVFLSGLFIQLDKAKYNCSNYNLGQEIDVQIFIPW